MDDFNSETDSDYTSYWRDWFASFFKSESSMTGFWLLDVPFLYLLGTQLYRNIAFIMDPRIPPQTINGQAVVYDAAREEYHVPEHGDGEDVISRIILRSEVVAPILNQAPPNPGNVAQVPNQGNVQSSADARDRNDSLALTETNVKRHCEDSGRLNIYTVTHVHGKIENWGKAFSETRDTKLPPAATQHGCEGSEYEDYFDWLVLRSVLWETEPSTNGKELESRSNTSAKPKRKKGEVIKPRGWRAIPRRRKQDRRITSHYIRGRYRLNKDARSAGVQFISSRGNEYFCEIDEEYLTDRFNLTGLNTEVQYYQYALDLVTDVFDLDCDDDMREQIEKSARHLYGLVHARYIVTTRGLAKMLDKFKKADFGKCPRVACDQQALLPMGQHDTPNGSPVKLYCAKCEDIYNPKSSRHATIDGAYFGTSFHNILFQVYPAMVPVKTQRRYEPKVFGFRVHASAALMRWQAERREEMKARLKKARVESGFEEEDDEEEMDEEEMEDDVSRDDDAMSRTTVQ
ncbi:casein kinase 2 regulatory subunit [Coniosporium tulheliwenetii]|uniref:Casein kinase 2 regulatory subunit n=1 Tax=Coniosporium tulheliwenetii TaxID=3383036 RepID=A0ACC2ZJX0_9PEZI|nr:casein kinase 2 regulatory subunit [Cladosporium sp. JES 115]